MNFDQADALNEAIRAVGIRHRALAVAALAPMGIHPGHKLLLLELAAGSRTQAQLAAASGYEPPSITESVRQLETAGLARRPPSAPAARPTLRPLTARLSPRRAAPPQTLRLRDPSVHVPGRIVRIFERHVVADELGLEAPVLPPCDEVVGAGDLGAAQG